MTEKEITRENNGPTNDRASMPRANLSSERQAAASMFAVADKIIQNITISDSERFLQQSKQHGGQ